MNVGANFHGTRRVAADSQPQRPDFLLGPLIVGLLLVVITLAVFAPVMRCGFLNYDDPDYFSSNPHVLTGLTTANLSWAFTTAHASNWHPLTWLSLMLDAEMFGRNPAGPHCSNLIIHAANTFLLFFLLRGLTRTTWRSAAVAALFALHPLHVESVAWISERKDVLSTFFCFLALLAYAKAMTSDEQPATPPSRRRPAFYWLSLLFFALGLMSKPMLVTLPFVLLLLDWWPLGRFSNNIPIRRLLLEKIPHFTLSAMACVVTLVVQHKGGAVATMAKFPLAMRAENALVSYARYLGKTFWPEPLALPYPHPGHWPLALILFSTGLLAVMCIAAVWSAKKSPFILTGWFWFVGMLIPVIGLVQVGDAAMADRYTYLPLVGIFIILVWGLAEVSVRLRLHKSLVILTATLVFFGIGWRTREQLKYWSDSGTLFRHTLAVTENNYVAENNLGTWLSANGQVAEAMDHFQRSLQIKPDDAATIYNFGNGFARLGRWDEAIENYRQSLQINPKQAEVLDNLGIALVAKKQFSEALTNYVAALKLKPDSSETHNNLGTLLFRQGNFLAAAEHFYEACRLEPSQPQFYSNLGDALVKSGNTKAAAECYQQALQLEPDNPKFKAKLQALGNPSQN